jgi:heavy metal translocating P-type ATPase
MADASSAPVSRRDTAIALLAVTGILTHLLLRYAAGWPAGPEANLPLLVVLIGGGMPQVWGLAVRMIQREFGSDLIAGVSILTALVLGEFLAGALVVLMLSGGAALESYAVRRASSVLGLLASRMPAVAHRDTGSGLEEVPLDQVQPDDRLHILPHETCPADGVVLEGHGTMDEAYLTGEPYQVPKTPGAQVISGALNGETALIIRVERRPEDSRYARIMRVMRDSEQRRPRLRRLGDRLGAIYTPLALAVAGGAWLVSGDPLRFLAVLVVATPCPLLIAIPVAIIGSISLAARRSIIVKDPAALEAIATCRVALFDKTGTLTYGEPVVTDLLLAPGLTEREVLEAAAGLERYSRHPLAGAVLRAAEAAQVAIPAAERISERPGEGLQGWVGGRQVTITSRDKLAQRNAPEHAALPPPAEGGMEAVVLLDGRYAGTLRFRDEPKAEGQPFIEHLGTRHHFRRVALVSGDRESEARHLAARVGIHEVHFHQSPEDKLARVRAETALHPTVFVGDGINDAPALAAATVGIAFGKAGDVTGEAAGVVILDHSLRRADEFLHIGQRMRRIALQSAVGGILLSLLGMGFAAAGHLTPVAGAILQEIIDVAAVLNALRAAWPPRHLADF